MMQTAVNNAKVLYSLDIPRKDVEEAHKIFREAPFLTETLTSPVVSVKSKEAVLDKLTKKDGLPELLGNFMKMMCRIGQIGQITDIFDCYYRYWDEKHDILRAEVTYADESEKRNESKIISKLEALYPGVKVVLTDKIDASLLGGYVIRAGYEEYDHSYEGKLRRLERKLT